MTLWCRHSRVNPNPLGCPCLCVSCVGPLCGPPLRWWVLCGALPSVWVPCLGPLGVPCVGPLCVGPLCGSPVWNPCVGPSARRVASCGIYSRDVSRSFTRSRSAPSGSNRLITEWRAVLHSARRPALRAHSSPKKNVLPGVFPRHPKTVGPDNKKTVTNQAKYSVNNQLFLTRRPYLREGPDNALNIKTHMSTSTSRYKALNKAHIDVT